MKLSRSNALIPLVPLGSADFRDKEGLPIILEDGSGAAMLCEDTSGVSVFGVIVSGAKAPEKITVAVAAGGLSGTVRVKLNQAVTIVGRFLQLVDVGGVIAFGPDSGAGERIVMAQALETGAVGELIEAVIFKPINYAS